MGFWTENATKQGPSAAPRVPAGQNQLEIHKILFGTKNGGYFQTKNGDRQILLIFRDSQERECSQMYTLSNDAAWGLAKLLDAAGLNLDKMDAAGVTIDKFTDERFTEANLLGRKFRADVSYEQVNGKEYSRIVPMPAAAKSTDGIVASPVQEQDISF